MWEICIHVLIIIIIPLECQFNEYVYHHFFSRVILLILVSDPEIRFLWRRFDVVGVLGLWGGTFRVFWGLRSIYKQKNNPGNINIIFSFFYIQKMDTLQQGCLLYKMEQITLTMKKQRWWQQLKPLGMEDLTIGHHSFAE